MEGLRQVACAGCRSIFFICRRCDRGQIYCGIGCRVRGRRQAQARANARHQASDEGRADHRDRQRAYMSRRRAMTYTGSVRRSREGKVRGVGELLTCGSGDQPFLGATIWRTDVVWERPSGAEW